MKLENNLEKYQANLLSTYHNMYRDGKDEWTDQAAMRVATRFLSTFLESLSGLKVLDIGCGAGRDAENLARNKAIVTGIDIVQHEDWDVLESEFSSLSFYKKSLFDFENSHMFDIALDNGCMHHQHPEQLEQYVKKVHSMLADKGIFLISTFYDDSSSMKLDPNGRVMRTFTAEELRQLVENLGFKQLDYTIVNRDPGKFHYLLSAFKKWK